MSFLGYMVIANLSKIKNAVNNDRFPTERFFGAREKTIWNRCATEKRKIEFLGGRLAAKVAGNVYRLSIGLDTCRWNQIDVFPGDDNTMLCHHFDLVRHSISISHSQEFAAAAIFPGADRVGIDIENIDFSRRALNALFVEPELKQISLLQDARQRWTIKETYGKLTGEGIIGYEKQLFTYLYQNRLFLIVLSELNLQGSVFLASGSSKSLAITIGFNVET